MRADSQRKKPANFQQAVALILDQMFHTMVERQRKYGVRNVRNLGILGVLERGARDKMERLFQFYEREDLRRRCLEAGMPPEVVDRYLPPTQADYQDETLEDAHIDAGNYVTVIALMLLRGWWGLPLVETDISLADALASAQEGHVADTALLRAARDVVRLHDEHIDPGMAGPYALAEHREAKHESIERLREALKRLDAEKVIVLDDDGTP